MVSEIPVWRCSIPESASRSVTGEIETESPYNATREATTTIKVGFALCSCVVNAARIEVAALRAKSSSIGHVRRKLGIEQKTGVR